MHTAKIKIELISGTEKKEKFFLNKLKSFFEGKKKTATISFH